MYGRGGVCTCFPHTPPAAASERSKRVFSLSTAPLASPQSCGGDRGEPNDDDDDDDDEFECTPSLALPPAVGVVSVDPATATPTVCTNQCTNEGYLFT